MIPIAVALLISDAGPTNDTLSDLSKILAQITKRSAIAVIPTYGKISIASDPKIVDDIVSPLRKEGYASLVSDVAVIYQMGIPSSHLGVLKGLVSPPGPDKGAFKEVTIPASAIKNGTITFETKTGEAIKVASLMNLELPRRIMVSPYFNFDNGGDFPLAMAAKDMAPGDFVRALTRGLSGKLVIEEKTYNINFDATSFRTNVAKTLVLAQRGVDAGRTPSGVNAQYAGGSYSDYQEFQDAAQPAHSSSKQSLTSALALLSDAINKMNDKSLEQTFAYKGSSIKLTLSNFVSLQDGVISYLRSSTPPPTGQPGADVQRQPQRGGAPTNLASLINRVDPRNPGKLVVTTDFRMSLELNLLSRGRPQQLTPNNVDPSNTITIQIL